MAFGRKEGDLGEFTRDHGIQAVRARMVEDDGIGDTGLRRSGNDGQFGLGCVGLNLDGRDPSTADGDDIGECAPDVHADHHLFLLDVAHSMLSPSEVNLIGPRRCQRIRLTLVMVGICLMTTNQPPSLSTG